MPGTTSRAAIPYPLPTDPLAQGAAQIKALADRVDALLVNFYAEKVEAEQITSNNAWTGFPTLLQMVAPEAGVYRFEFGAYVDTGGANFGMVGLQVNGGAMAAEPNARTLTVYANGNAGRVCSITLNAGDSVNYIGLDQGNSGRRCTFSKRYMHVSRLIQGALAELRDDIAELERPDVELPSD